MEIVGIDNSNPYRKIIIDDALIKLLHSISSDDSCYVKIIYCEPQWNAIEYSFQYNYRHKILRQQQKNI